MICSEWLADASRVVPLPEDRLPVALAGYAHRASIPQGIAPLVSAPVIVVWLAHERIGMWSYGSFRGWGVDCARMATAHYAVQPPAPARKTVIAFVLPSLCFGNPFSKRFVSCLGG